MPAITWLSQSARAQTDLELALASGFGPVLVFVCLRLQKALLAAVGLRSMSSLFALVLAVGLLQDFASLSWHFRVRPTLLRSCSFDKIT